MTDARGDDSQWRKKYEDALRELDRQRALTLAVAERLFLAAEVLSIVAERKDRRGDKGTRST